MAKTYQEYPYRQYFSMFGGGLSTQEEPQKIPINASPDMLNCRPIGQGAYGPRNGIRRIGDKITGTGSRSGIFTFAKGLTEILVSPRGTTIDYLRKSDNTWQEIPGLPAQTNNLEYGFANDNQYLYFCNAKEDFTIWDGNDLSGTFTAAADNIITSNAHGLVSGNLVTFTTTGTLPAGLTVGVVYFVISGSLTANTFKVSETYGGTEVDITDTGTGVHTFSSSVKTYAAAPKGNIMQMFNNRLWVSGIIASPTSVQYSVINVAGTTPSFDFSGSGSGTYAFNKDGGYITALKVFVTSDGIKSLKVFKKNEGTYNMYFDSSGNLAVLDGEQDTGAVNQKSTLTVENDILYIDNGNNINKLGLVENINGQVRTESTTTGLDRTTISITLDNSAAIYWKKRRMAVFAGKSYGSDNNDIVLVYFYDFKSWWMWTGIYANEFAIYNDNIVWASSVDNNVYTYDETVFDDNVDGDDGEGSGSIASYRHSKDIEYGDENGIAYSDRYKQARFATFKGYISEGASMTIGVMYDGNPENKVSATFKGSTEDITMENVAVYFGANVFGYQTFGGSSLSPSAFPMREFFVVLSLSGDYSFLRARLFTEVQGAGVPYVITHQALYSSLSDIEKWPDAIKI